MDDHEQDNQMATKDRRDPQMSKTASQPLLQLQTLKQGLKNDKTRERGELLIFEPEAGNPVDFCLNLCFAGLHLRWPPGSGYFVFAKSLLPSIHRPPQAFLWT
jgi:hypothetical protein